MPPKSLKGVVADRTDPATLRPDLPPEPVTGTGFIPMNCPDFKAKINLPPGIEPSNAWGIFKLFFPEEQVQILVNHTNEYHDRSYAVPTLRSRAHDWQPVSLREIYAYIGIRIYIGIHPENQLSHYWRQGPAYPSHPVIDVMSLRRFQAIHRGLRLAGDEEDHPIEGVFDRASQSFFNRI
jgi:hypothetical protein